MLETTCKHTDNDRSEARQVKALLRLVQDLGYDVTTGPAGEWTVSRQNDLGERTIVGIDSAREVAAAARILAESLHVESPLLHVVRS